MKPPAFSYKRLRDRRDRIANVALRPYIGANVIGETVRDICRDAVKELPDAVSQLAVFDSVRALAGTKLTQRAAADLAWRLAGNIGKLTAGQPILPWTRQLEDEIVPVMVEGVRPFKRRNTPGFIFSCRALAGSPCPLLFTQFLSRASCGAISQSIGFSKSWGPYPYHTALHFVNLLFFAHIEAAKSREAPFFSKVSASSSMIQANRERIEVRVRAKPCPDHYEHACVHCWLGYDQCTFATHARTYVSRHCANCNTEGFFDPADTGVMCVRCRYVASHHAESVHSE